MRALRLRGRRVPGDVAIIGCDHLEFGPALEPPLTTIDLGGQALVDAMMHLVFSQLDGRRLPRAERQRIIAPELIVREST